ncbi:glycine/D-amino acid oxidase, deaminating [Pseudomonas sp. GM84]|uniref:NAD(P)/FAD-dependent oxidoreductase n=1 Tax=Pseudomonas sp. GM84 TaxID=1144340 RepID=UPI00026FCF64|nr:FAD-binding oxidoreductase [Pseudomonas sp. GM84]EJN39606.1 glycine/D-amino acid oxidase, deaminating [Pseudomonas sp. GM84]
MTSNSQHAPSYYAATARKQTRYPTLDGSHTVNVCVIGGGLTGVNTALELAERGLSVILLEGRQIGWGASGRNGGQLIRGIGHDVSGFSRFVGTEGVRYLKQAGLDSVALVARRIEQYAIKCDLRWGFCDLANTRSQFEAFEDERNDLQDLGYKHETRIVPPERIGEVVGSTIYAGAMVDMGSGHLHPLDLVQGEASAASRLGVAIFENSPVLSIGHGKTVTVKTAQGQVRADALVLGCNAHLDELEPRLSGKVLPAGSYIITTEPLSEDLARSVIPQNMAMCDQKVGLDYYRLTADRRLLFGGACHYTGRDPKDITGYMRPKMLKVFPQLKNARIDYEWGGMIGITSNRFPQVGCLQDHPNVFYAQGYSGHGLNVTHWTAKLLAEVISRDTSKGFEVFSTVPHFTFPGGKAFRSPLLALGMLWHRLRESLG